MSLTRKMLKAMGIEDEKIEQIIDAHSETVEALKEQAASYKADAEKLSDVQKQLDNANKTIEAAGKDDFKTKYEALQQEFEKYKTDIAEKETHSAKISAYREMLKNAGVSEKRIDTIIKVSDVDGVEIDEKGKIKDIDKLTETVKTEWADFIETEGVKGAKTSTPPNNENVKKDPFLEGFGD